MKRTCLLIIWTLTCLTNPLAAQTPVSAVIESGNLKAVVNANGALFWDFSNGQFIAPYEPGQDEISLLRASGIWVAGVDPGGNIKVSAQLYDSNGDFEPGLINPGAGPVPFNKIWRVTAADVAQHVADWADNQFIDNPLPNIFSWPARGNPAFEQYNPGLTLPNLQYGSAGFFDRDGDGIYNPAAGDFPVLELRGCEQAIVPSEMLWFSFHDQRIHNETQGAPLNMEIQTLVFTFECPDVSVLNDAVFVRYKLINHGEENLEQTYFGVFTDFDIGSPGDDYVGCDPSRQLVFGYNGNPADALYDHPPAMAVDMLRGPLDEQIEELPLAHMLPFGNGTGPQGYPNIPIHYYQLMSGNWLDGSPAPNNGLLFTGDPNVPDSDSELALGNPPGDRRVIATYEPFKLQPGAVNEVILGYYFTQMPGADALENVASMYDRADVVQDLFDNCFSTLETNCALAVNTQAPFEAPQRLSIFPNPANRQVTLQLGNMQGTALVTAFDAAGRSVLTTQLAGINPELDISSLAPGMYWLKVITDTGLTLAGSFYRYER